MADQFSLRCYSYLDRMQPQFAAFVGTITQGDLPTEELAKELTKHKTWSAGEASVTDASSAVSQSCVTWAWRVQRCRTAQWRTMLHARR